MALKKSQLYSSLWQSCDEYSSRVESHLKKMGLSL